MLRCMLLSLCLVFCTFLAACEQGTGQEKQKIGVVNINRIMVDSTAGRAAAKYIEGIQDSLRDQLTALQGKAEDTKDPKKPSEEEVQKLQAAYGKLQAEQQNVQNILNAALHRTVERYRINNGYSMILFSDVVLSFEPSVDITSAITAELNKEKVEFTPIEQAKDAEPAPTQEAGNAPKQEPASKK